MDGMGNGDRSQSEAVCREFDWNMLVISNMEEKYIFNKVHSLVIYIYICVRVCVCMYVDYNLMSEYDSY